MVDLPWLARLLLRLEAASPPDDPLMGIDGLSWQRLFTEAQEELGLPKILGRQALYVLRHSGASADAWLNRRAVGEIQKRGRWQSVLSTCRHEKGGRLAERFGRCSDQIQKFSRKCVTQLERVLGQRCAPLPGPWTMPFSR